MKIKVTYILSNIDKALAYEWIALNIGNSSFELSFILLNQKEPYLHRWLEEHNIKSYYIHHIGKKSYPFSILKVLKILRIINPSVVHTHLFDANLIGLFSAKLLGIKKRIYTRHHSTYHHDNFPKAVKYDLWSNKMATNIVAISVNVKDILIAKEGVEKSKIELIHHGFDLDRFKNVHESDVKLLKKKYNINDEPVVGIISRYIKLKGIQYVIPAFKNILKKYPNAILVLANAKGLDAAYIKQLLQSIPAKNIREIEFEPNLFALYKLFTIYIHVPINRRIEAFGQTYVEALAAGIPSIFTLSGVANEFVKNNENAFVVDYKQSQEIEKKILLLLNNKEECNRLIINGQKSISPFTLNKYILNLEELYK